MSCSLCHGPHDWDVACPPAPREPKSHAFEAKYDGWCRDCRKSIYTGHLIVIEDDQVFHEGCR